MSILLFDFFFGGKPSSTFGRTGVHYRHPFASDQVSFSLVGLVQVYIACIRPTNVSIAIVSVETVFATLLLDDHSLVEQEAEQLFEFRLSVGLFHDFGISRFEGCTVLWKRTSAPKPFDGQSHSALGRRSGEPSSHNPCRWDPTLIRFLRKAKGELVEGFGADDGGGNDAPFGQCAVFGNLKHCLRLVVKFGADMPSRIVIPFVEMKHGLNVDILLACPLHQVAHNPCRLRGVVDVEHQITNTVNDHQTHVGRVVNGITDDFSTLVWVGNGSKVAEFQMLRFSVNRQSCQSQNALHHELAMIRALLRVKVEDISFRFGE